MPSDPFDVSNTDAPAQSGGLSPDAMRNLAAFGAAMSVAANARTAQGFLQYGPGIAGPLGAGILSAQQQNLENARIRSSVGLQSAQTQNQLLQTQIARLGLPLAQLRAKAAADPNFLQSIMGGASSPASTGDQSSATPTGGAAGSPLAANYTSSIAQMESGGDPNATNPLWPPEKGGPAGVHGFTADTWNNFAKANPQYFPNMNQDQILAARKDVGLSGLATQWLAAQNAPVLQAAGILPTPQNLGIAHALGGAGAAGVLKFSDATPLPQAFAASQPSAAQSILAQNPQYQNMTVGQLRQKYAAIGSGQQTAGMPAPYQVASAGPTPGPPQAGAGNPTISFPAVGMPGATAPRVDRSQSASGNPTISIPNVGMPGSRAPGAPGGGLPPGAQVAQSQPMPAPGVPQIQIPQGAAGAPVMSAAEAMQRSNQAAQRAVAAQLLGFDATPATTEAQQYRNYALQLQQQQNEQRLGLQFAGPKAYATSQAELPATLAGKGFYQDASGNLVPIPGGPADPNYIGLAGAQKPFDTRQGGMHWDAVHGWVKNPQLETIQDAQGNTIPVHIVPGTPGTNEPGRAEPVIGPNGQPIVTKLPQQVTEGREAIVKEFLGKDTDAYTAAQNTQAWLNQMDHASDVMNANGGLTTTGPSIGVRMSIVGGVNDAARVVGLSQPFDQGAVASYEEFKKATTTAGFELSSHYEGHARQAAQTILNATAAVPTPANSPIGQKLVSAGIREGAQSAIDAHEYKQAIYNQTQGAGLESAETDFYKANPAQMYARRAISTVQPYTVSSEAQFKRYLPGTYVILPNGKLTQVPERVGAPGIPEYLQQQNQSAAPASSGAMGSPGAPVVGTDDMH